MELPTYECQKCHHVWVPNKVNPKQCPKCKNPNWNPGRIDLKSLTPSEFNGLQWILRTCDVTEDQVYKSHGSPDYKLTDGRGFEIKQLSGLTVRISETQIGRLHDHPDCKVVVFKNGMDDNPIAVFKASEINPNDEKTLEFGKFGDFRIEIYPRY